MPYAIIIENLTKRFGDREAVKPLTLSIGQSEIFGMLGPNGSGKTTLIRMLCGLLAPFVDDVSVFGQALHIRVKDLPPEPISADAFASFAASARRAMVIDVLRKRLLAARIEVLTIRSVYPSLEDIFVSYTRRMDQTGSLE